MPELSPECVPAFDLPLAEQAAVFSAAYQDYLAGPFTANAAELSRILYHQGADLWLSRFLRVHGQWAGFGYINRTGERARLAGMGFVPSARGQGLGRRLLEQLILESRDRGERGMSLEVFEQNHPAVALYRKAGFRDVGRLYGWRHSGFTFDECPEIARISEIPVDSLLNRPHAIEYPDLPWQISRHALACLPPGARTYTLEDAALIIGDPVSPAIPVRILAATTLESRAMNWPALRTLAQSVIASIPGRTWTAPQLFPEPFGPSFFEPLGFQRLPLNQILMGLEHQPG